MTTRIALRIEVPGYRAALTLPPLLDRLQRHAASASFAVALGPDWLGRSVAKRGALILRQLQGLNCEIGIGGWRPREWAKLLARADGAAIEASLRLARTAFSDVFDTPPKFHAAPAWRSSPQALRLTQRLEFEHASDARGRHPFVPVWNGEIIRCPQIPTTLPAYDEIPVATTTAHERILALHALTLGTSAPIHVFGFRAGESWLDREDALDRLLAGWREQGHELVALRTLAADLSIDKLPRHEVMSGTVPGRKETVLLQGNEFLSAWRTPA